MKRIQRATFCPFTITGWEVMSFTFFLSLGVLKIFEASKLVLAGNFSFEYGLHLGLVINKETD